MIQLAHVVHARRLPSLEDTDRVARPNRARMSGPLRPPLIGHVLPRAKSPAAGLIAWADDLPPFPILSGEVARVEVALAIRAKPRHRRLAA
jgi:hypothetical protein